MELKKYSYDNMANKLYAFLKNDNKWDYVNSNEISTIQTQLKIIGYPCKVDGAFGNVTENIIKLFQLNNNIDNTGIYCNNTSIILNNYINKFVKIYDNKMYNDIYETMLIFYTDIFFKYNFVFNHNEINIIGIRQNMKSDLRLNRYDDSIILIGNGIYEIFIGSTDPGVNNAYIIQAPQQIKYYKGLHHRKYHCLRPKENQIIEYSGYGIIKHGHKWFNLHAGGSSRYVNNWSEGCQVIKGGWHGKYYKKFLKYTYDNNKQIEFNYTLFTSNDLFK